VDTSASKDIAVAATSYATPPVTTRAAGDLLVAAYIGGAQASPPASWSAPAGMVQRVNAGDGGLLSLSNDEVAQPAAGVSGTFTAGASSMQGYALTALLALRP
jgi:hypothetical protein